MCLKQQVDTTLGFLIYRATGSNTECVTDMQAIVLENKVGHVVI